MSGCSSPAQEASESGRAKWDHKDYDGALAEYERAVVLDPGYAPAYVGRGAAKLEKGDLDGAIADCTRGVNLDPKSAPAYGVRAGARYLKKDYTGSIADYTRAIELDPSQAVAHYNRGIAKADLDDADGAIADYTRAIELNPHYPEAFYNRGLARKSKGQIDEAIADLTQALKFNPKDVESYCVRGVVRMAKQDWDGAIADFSQALQIDPKNACLYSNRGIAKLRKEDWDGAIADFKRAVELHPQDANSYLGLAQAMFSKEDLKGASAALDQVLKLDPHTLGEDKKKALEEMLRQVRATLEAIAAKVNGEVLTWKYVREGLQSIKPDQITPELLRAKRQELVASMLIRQFAARHHLAVSDAEVDEAVERDRKKYPLPEDQQKVINIQYGSRSKFRASLQWSLLRAKALDHAVATQGSDPELKGTRFIPETIPEEELRRYFEGQQDSFKAVEQISFMRIGLKIGGPGSEVRTLAYAESLLRRLDKGAEMTMLVYFYSDVPRAKGFRDRGVTRKDLDGIYAPETIAYLFDGMKEGETSGIMKDGATLNIFKLEQKLKHGAETFLEAQGRIRSLLEVGVRDKNVASFVQALRRSADIEPADVFEEK